MTELELHVPTYNEHCAVSFYKDGSCTLHFHKPDCRRWVAIDDVLYLVDRFDNKIPLSRHFQEAYKNHLLESVLLT